MPDASKMIRVSTRSLENARAAFEALMATRKLNYLIDLDGSIRCMDKEGVFVDKEGVFAVHGRQGIAFLLACLVGARYDALRGESSEPRVTDRQLIDGGLRALTDILEEATRKVAGEV